MLIFIGFMIFNSLLDAFGIKHRLGFTFEGDDHINNFKFFPLIFKKLADHKDLQFSLDQTRVKQFTLVFNQIF